MTGKLKRGIAGLVLVFVCLAAAGAAVLFAPDPAGAPEADPADVDLSALDRVPPATWESLAGKRIYFGHQSVGSNIVEGLAEVLRRKPHIKIRIAEASDADALDTPGLVHGPIGANMDVPAKLADFANFVRGPKGEKIDIAMMKLCYADLDRNGSPSDVAQRYRNTVESLRKERPDVKLVHITMPLTVVQSGPKARIKKLIGQSPWKYQDNIAREHYNRQLGEWFGSEPGFFDLAASESTLPDGRCAQFSAARSTWRCLSTAYASDNGHLNAAGQLAAARDLLLALVAASK